MKKQLILKFFIFLTLLSTKLVAAELQQINKNILFLEDKDYPVLEVYQAKTSSGKGKVLGLNIEVKTQELSDFIFKIKVGDFISEGVILTENNIKIRDLELPLPLELKILVTPVLQMMESTSLQVSVQTLSNENPNGIFFVTSNKVEGPNFQIEDFGRIRAAIEVERLVIGTAYSPRGIYEFTEIGLAIAGLEDGDEVNLIRELHNTVVATTKIKHGTALFKIEPLAGRSKIYSDGRGGVLDPFVLSKGVPIAVTDVNVTFNGIKLPERWIWKNIK